MYKRKIYSFLLTLLCLLTSSAVWADGDSPTFVRPTIDSEDEISVFLLSPVRAEYAFNGYGNDYQTPSKWPGDIFEYVGQQSDGLYLYKWTRPEGATGVPGNFTLTKNYKDVGDAGKIYINNDPNNPLDPKFVNHGVFMEYQEKTNKDEVTYQDHVVSTTIDDKFPLAQVNNDDEHSLFFETPKEYNYYIWPYGTKSTNSVDPGGDYYASNSKDADGNPVGAWPGDQMTEVGQLPNKNFLYKWTQKNHVDDMPRTVIISRDNGGDHLYESTYYQNGYYLETIESNVVSTTVQQFGTAYPKTTYRESTIDPLATLDDPNEVSIFLELPEEKEYNIWPFDNSGRGGEYYTNVENNKWPGETFVEVGQLPNGHYLYKWKLEHINDVPDKVIIGCSDNDHQYDGGAFTNHGYYTLGDDDKITVKSETVTRLSDGTALTARTVYGKRVIYEMNVGSFTTEGTFKAATARLNYLKDLGVDVIWLMPIYPRGKKLNSPYAVKDFEAINSAYGDQNSLKQFVSAAHDLGLDVWLDFVPNHAAVDNVWLDSSAENKAAGKYHPEYFIGYNKENPEQSKFVQPTGYDDVYELDYNTQVPISEGSDETYNPLSLEMGNILVNWVKDYDIDGFRFDFASSPTLPDGLWNALTTRLKSVKPTLQFLAEADFSRDGLTQSNFQYDYAWDFNDKLRDFSTSTNTYDEDATTWDFTSITSRFLSQFDPSSNDYNHIQVNSDRMVYLMNHDKNYGSDSSPKTMKGIWGDNRYMMTVFEFTMPGMPLIYNGQEQDGSVSLNYFRDTKIDWDGTRDYKMLGLIQELTHLKHTNDALSDGSNSSQRGETHILNSIDHNVFAYERINGDKHVIVALNFNNEPKSSTILGVSATGTWNLVLKGNKDGIENIGDGVTDYITDQWNINQVPANGYMVFTYTGPSDNVASDGIYFVGDDSWNNRVKHKMAITSTDDKYNYYQLVIPGNEFDAYNTPEDGTKPADDDPLYFKFQEYYSWHGSMCRKDQMYCAGKQDGRFTSSGTSQFDFSMEADGANNAFSIVKGTDVDRYIITFARSKSNSDAGYVSVEVITNGSILPGYYLLTPVNINATEEKTKLQWRLKSQAEEDNEAYNDKWLQANYPETKKNYLAFTINASDFDKYLTDDRRALNTIQFRIEQVYTGEGGKLVGNTDYIGCASEDAENENSTFDESRWANKVYDNAHWIDSRYFKIVYQPDVEKYIIQMWEAGDGTNTGQIRVRVYYVRKFNYAGSDIDDMAKTNEDVYLYNVDAQKFLYVGNNWGTMASLLYDDLGTRLNISPGQTSLNPDYKLIKTRMDAVTTVPNGHMLGIDDFRYKADSKDAEKRLDEGHIFCDRDNGDRWLFEKADSVDYANTYIMRLYDKKDGRYHIMMAEHSDTDPTQNTKVKYIAQEMNTMTADNIFDGKYVVDGSDHKVTRDGNTQIGHRIGWIGNGQGYIEYTFNAPTTGTYDIDAYYVNRNARNLGVSVDGGTPIVKRGHSTGTSSAVTTAAALQYTFYMTKGEHTIRVADQTKDDGWAPDITKVNISVDRPENLKYARWQLITYQDLVNKLKNENADLYGGTSADATFLMKDQGFTRNIPSTDESSWSTKSTSTENPVKLTKNTIGDVEDNGMYWNGRIGGIGYVYQDVDVPIYGLYQFDAYGFTNDQDNPAKLFYQYATSVDKNGNVTGWSPEQYVDIKYANKTYNGKQSDIDAGQLFYNESVLGNSQDYLNTLYIYIPQEGDTKANHPSQTVGGNYKLRIGFYKPAVKVVDGKNADYTAVDDVHLHYCGKNTFLLSDSWTNYSTTIDKNTSHDDRTNVPIYLERKFTAGCWNTLVLPVSVSTTQLRRIFGTNVQVATPYGLDDNNPYLIKFTAVDLSGGTAIEAGRFYIVRPEKLVGSSSVTMIDANNNITTPTADDGCMYYNLGNHDIADIGKSEAGTLNVPTFNAKSAKNPWHNSITINGSYSYIEQLPFGSYAFTTSGRMVKLDSPNYKSGKLPLPSMGGFRFYITDNDDGYDPNKKSDAKSFELSSMSDDLDAILAMFDRKDDSTTGITDIDSEDNAGAANDKFGNGNVYDLSGRRVAVDGELDSLPRGVYIINGKKYIKK